MKSKASARSARWKRAARMAGLLLLFSAMAMGARGPAHATDAPPEPGNATIRMVRAVMCESIDGYEPKYIAVAFSINAGRISCYTLFDDVVETTVVDHKWYRQDELVTTKRLTIKPPKWATYSSILLREEDKGPWRVEIWNAQSRLIKTLRFSVID